MIIMLNIWDVQQKFGAGLSRRNFLKIGAFGAGLTLADMLRLRAQADNVAAPRAPNKAAIMVYLHGGPSQVDTYDLKPEAPVEYRGEFRPIPTNVPGVRICEHFPRQARIFDRLAVIRSLETVNEHNDALVMTGYSDNNNSINQHPSFGSVVSRVRGNRRAGVPPFVSLRGVPLYTNPNRDPGCEPGYLGVAHRPFSPRGEALANLGLPGGVTMDRLADRRGLLHSFDQVRRDIDASGTMQGLDAFTASAFDMVASGAVRRALDLSLEEPRVRDRYRGVEQFLTARRLVEAGVSCVTLLSNADWGRWDTHFNNFRILRDELLPELDRGVSNLIEDLVDRGMDKDVVTVVWGEFGRSPRINANAGRDHWPSVMSALVAGGGLRMGQVIGSSSDRGEYPRDRRMTPSNVLSTIYRTLGIDPAMTFPNRAGRPMSILDERDPVTELL
jgi:Protein of unknown function (DUF1501)